MDKSQSTSPNSFERCEIWSYAEAPEIDGPMPDRRYLTGPITPHVLRLEGGKVSSLDAFMSLLGYPRDLIAWGNYRNLWPYSVEPMVGPTPEWLRKEWKRRRVSLAWKEDQNALREGWAEATHPLIPQKHKKNPTGGTILVVSSSLLTEASDSGRFRSGFVWDNDLRALVISPADLVTRSWFELARMAERGGTTQRCEWCSQLFPPVRRVRRFCPGTSCRDEAYRATYDKSDYRKAYQRNYKRFKRGKISHAEWDVWRDENGPHDTKGGKSNGHS